MLCRTASLDPFLESAVAGLVGRVAFGEAGPLGAGAQDPENATEYLSGVSSGASFAVRSSSVGNQWGEDVPLLVAEVHPLVLHSSDHPLVLLR